MPLLYPLLELHGLLALPRRQDPNRLPALHRIRGMHVECLFGQERSLFGLHLLLRLRRLDRKGLSRAERALFPQRVFCRHAKALKGNGALASSFRGNSGRVASNIAGNCWELPCEDPCSWLLGAQSHISAGMNFGVKRLGFRRIEMMNRGLL